MKAVHVYFASVLLLLTYMAGAAHPNDGDALIKEEGENKSLVLQGKVAGIKLGRENLGSIVFEVKLDLKFVNNSDQPILLLRREFSLGAKTLADSPEAALAYSYIYVTSHWPAASISPEWSELRRKLDQRVPPKDPVRVLAPGEELPYESNVTMYIEKAGSMDGTSQAWDKIKQVSPVWLQVRFEMWPTNIEPHVDPENPAFGKKLQRRWQQYGNLEIERLTSEPMPLDLASHT